MTVSPRFAWGRVAGWVSSPWANESARCFSWPRVSVVPVAASMKAGVVLGYPPTSFGLLEENSCVNTERWVRGEGVRGDVYILGAIQRRGEGKTEKMNFALILHSVLYRAVVEYHHDHNALWGLHLMASSVRWVAGCMFSYSTT